MGRSNTRRCWELSFRVWIEKGRGYLSDLDSVDKFLPFDPHRICVHGSGPGARAGRLAVLAGLGESVIPGDANKVRLAPPKEA